MVWKYEIILIGILIGISIGVWCDGMQEEWKEREKWEVGTVREEKKEVVPNRIVSSSKCVGSVSKHMIGI